MTTRAKAPRTRGDDTNAHTTVAQDSVPNDATCGNAVSIDGGVTAVTRNGTSGVMPGAVTPLRQHTKRGASSPPPRGITAKISSLALRDAIYERALLLANKFRVVRTLDIAACCFPERPYSAALFAAQRAVRGLVKADLLRRYKTDRHQTVYGLTQRGVDWLGEHGYDASSSVRRVSSSSM